MGGERPQTLWDLARAQHWVLTRKQLLARGLTAKGIEHRLAEGRLHRVRAGVYAVGVPDLTRHGRWMAAVLACGRGAALSHSSAGALHGIVDRERLITVSVPAPRDPRHSGMRVRRVVRLAEDTGACARIPVTSPVRTLFDLATELPAVRLEAAVNAADRLDLVDPESLRAEVAARAGRPGVRALRAILDRHTFVLTDSELERRFLRLVRRAGLAPPETQARVSGFRVDFHWPELGLVVETDGLRYHRTPAQQATDRRRDQAHAAAGLTCLRFTHAQVSREPAQVTRILSTVAARLTL